jgi:predicted 2-oxoglutarate/Fe(II)-dependent dioxygenase YbiX
MPPQFNRYTSNQNYGRYIDSAIRQIAGSKATYARTRAARSCSSSTPRSSGSLPTKPKHASLVDLAGVYHNLLRTWADA